METAAPILNRISGWILLEATTPIYPQSQSPPRQSPPRGTPSPPPAPAPEPEAEAPVGNLEVPGPNSFQSGIGYIRGWVCEGQEGEIYIDDGLRLPATARGLDRADTEAVCGDRDNGFILVWNWNLMGDGQYTAALVVDGKTISRNQFTVTTLGQEYIRGAEQGCCGGRFSEPGRSDHAPLARVRTGIRSCTVTCSIRHPARREE